MKFRQDMIENDIGELVPRGLRKEVAARTAIYKTIVYGYFNGDDPRKSPWFETILVMDALFACDPQAADAVWRKINEYVDASRPRTNAPATLDVDRELGNLSKEFSDIIVAKCENQPLTEIVREIDEAQRQLEIFRQSVYQREGLTLRTLEEQVN